MEFTWVGQQQFQGPVDRSVENQLIVTRVIRTRWNERVRILENEIRTLRIADVPELQKWLVRSRRDLKFSETVHIHVRQHVLVTVVFNQ